MSDITRRACLSRIAAAGTAIVGALAGDAFPAETDASIPFGFSLYGMKTVPPLEALKNCAEIGYDGVELPLLPDWPTDPAKLTPADRRDIRARLSDLGLSLLGLMENLSEPADGPAHRGNLDRLKTAAEIGHFLSPDRPPCIETILGGRPAQWEAMKDRLVEKLHRWAEVAAATRTVIAVKPHVSNALHAPEGATWLVDRIDSPWLQLAFDYSHFQLRGLPMAATLDLLLPKTAFLHVKDARGTPDRVEFLLPGDGEIDYGDYFRRVRQSAYRGPVVVEVSGQISGRPGYDPIEAARRSFRNLAPALKKAGLRKG